MQNPWSATPGNLPSSAHPDTDPATPTRHFLSHTFPAPGRRSRAVEPAPAMGAKALDLDPVPSPINAATATQLGQSRDPRCGPHACPCSYHRHLRPTAAARPTAIAGPTTSSVANRRLPRCASPDKTPGRNRMPSSMPPRAGLYMVSRLDQTNLTTSDRREREWLLPRAHLALATARNSAPHAGYCALDLRTLPVLAMDPLSDRLDHPTIGVFTVE